MVHTVELIPQVGVIVDSKTIRLGDARADVEKALGEGENVRWNSLYYFASELRVDFGEEGHVEFIELLGGPDGKLQPVIFGLPAFQAPPETVLELLKEKNGGDFLDTEKGYSYAFKKISVGLYRESIPENLAEMIAEAEADGHPLSEEDIEYEKRRTHWATIGVGAEGYYE
ncbi:MAG: hypothetical protein HDT38_05560 [Clostridiales bacterium]|nr:hypothetical protein [Clostridiales bacterium]